MFKATTFDNSTANFPHKPKSVFAWIQKKKHITCETRRKRFYLTEIFHSNKKKKKKRIYLSFQCVRHSVVGFTFIEIQIEVSVKH